MSGLWGGRFADKLHANGPVGRISLVSNAILVCAITFLISLMIPIVPVRIALQFIGVLAMAVAGASSAMLRWLAARTELLSGAAGAVMLAIGVVMVLGWYQQFFARLVGSAPWSPFEPSV